jgi:hypothetical protein
LPIPGYSVVAKKINRFVYWAPQIFGILILVAAFIILSSFVCASANVGNNSSFLTVKGNNLEISYDPQTYRFVFPLDVALEREITVKNIGESIVALDWFITVEGPEGVSFRGNAFPQGSAMYLYPDESKKVFAKIDWGDMMIGSRFAGAADYAFNLSIAVFPKDHKENSTSVYLTNTIGVISRNGGYQVEDPSRENYVQPNAWISGYVRNKASNDTLGNAEVRANQANGFVSRMMVDSNGFYKLPLFAYNRVARNAYSEVDLRIQARGYKVYNKALVPQPGDNLSMDIYLDKGEEYANYSLVARFDTGPLHLHRGDGSADGTFIALVPFHSVNVTEQQISDNAYVWFFNKNGTLLWKYKLGYQSSTVDVSDDGLYVATAVQSGILGSTDPSPANAILLDNKGNLLWKFYPPHEKIVPYEVLPRENKAPMETRISHDDKYYAVGCDDGSLYLLNLSTKGIIWQRFLDGGQIRFIQFDENDSRIYVSEGEGYLYAFNLDGSLAWKTYVDSWDIDMAISKNYIFSGGKVGHFVSLLDKKTGKVLWKYPIDMVPDRLIISPDESFFYLSIASGAPTMGAAFFDRDGNLTHILSSGNPATVTSDSKYLLVSSRQDVNTGNDVGVPLIKLIDVQGDVLWSEVMDGDLTANHPAHQGYSWISEDKKELVLSSFQYVYFFKGGIEATDTKDSFDASYTCGDGICNDAERDGSHYCERDCGNIIQKSGFWDKIGNWFANLFKIR